MQLMNYLSKTDCRLIIYLWHLVYEISWTEIEDLGTCIIHAMVGQKPGGGGTPLYLLYRYVRPKECGFSAVLVINRVSILADFGHFGHK